MDSMPPEEQPPSPIPTTNTQPDNPAPLMPSPSPAGHQAEPFIFTLGDIGVTPTWVVTPNGSAPLKGSQWLVSDQSRTETKIPSWAIVMAIIFAILCLLGLFFLLIKERTTTGYVEVTVRGHNLYHVTQIPISGAEQLQHVRYLVHQAQTMAAHG
jgi:hypothetical protein